MSDLYYRRCPHDDWKAASAVVGQNMETGQPVEIDVHGAAAATSLSCAMLGLTAAMKVGYEKDFLERIALAVYPHVEGDPHMLCPILTVLSMLLLLSRGEADVTFDNEGFVQIKPPDLGFESGPVCMHEDDYDGSHEETLGRDGASEGRGGLGEIQGGSESSEELPEAGGDGDGPDQEANGESGDDGGGIS